MFKNAAVIWEIRTNAYRYSITVQCDDLAIVYCLRGLSMYSQGEGNVYTPWKGTGKADWKRNDRRVTFRFTSPRFRGTFLQEANRILPNDSFQEVCRDDNDPPLDL